MKALACLKEWACGLLHWASTILCDLIDVIDPEYLEDNEYEYDLNVQVDDGFYLTVYAGNDGDDDSDSDEE